MEILSVTNKKTQLHKSPSDLSVICSHEHIQKRTASSDISFFLNSVTPKCFAQTYKTDILEIWRVKTAKDGTDNFDRVRKLKIDGIQAISCSKTKDDKPEFALGFISGQIKILEFNEKCSLVAELSRDVNSKESVVSLDYSNCSGYLSSVYENGIINIYGLKTKIKADTVKIDRDSSLARFSPAKRFHLAIASFKGSVSIYDIASKKIYFQQKNAHDAPCRDLAMPEDVPDRLLSCGCDSLIKIFDTRQKATGLQIQSSCGLSTISVSKCAGFFGVGNLKGDLITYDMRSLRQPLTKMKVDNELVTRIAFMPTWGEGIDSRLSTLAKRTSSYSTASEDLPDIPETSHDFSIEDIVKFQKGRISDFETNIVSRVSTSNDAPRATEQRISMNFGRNVKNAMNDLSFNESFTESTPKSPEPEERISILDRIRRVSGGKKDSVPKRRSSLMPSSPLQLIREENIDKENRAGSLNKLSCGTPSDKEAPRFSSTPLPPSKTDKETAENRDESAGNKEETSAEVIDVDALDSSVEVTASTQTKKSSSETPTLVHQPSLSTPQFNIDIKKEFDALHEKTEKINFEVQSLSMDSNGRHIELMMHVSSQRRELQSRIQMVEECLGILMSDDVKINRIMELQQENQDLRHQLNEVKKRLKN